MIPSWFPATLPSDIWLRNAQVPAAVLESPPALPDHEGLVRLDLRVSAGRIAAIAPAGAVREGIDLDRGQVWPCFVDGHVHLDKTQTWPRQPNPDGTHPGAKNAVIADRGKHYSEADIEPRFDFGLRCALAHGTAAIRTHLDSYWPNAKAHWAVFRRLRDAWAGRIDLQAVSICPLERFAGDDGVALADEVAASGGILGMTTTGEGGQASSPGFQALLDRFFSLAEERGLALDLHLDETGDSSSRTLDAVARAALRRGFKAPIQVGHVCSLSVQTNVEAMATITLCADAGLRVINLPMCNMYLQGRLSGRTPRWRGITMVHEFRAAGVPVSFASDNCRDPFYAYGDYDMMEVYREAVRIAQLDHPFGGWAASVTATPAASCGFTERGRIAVGVAADLVLFRARSMTELLARPQSDRAILRNGKPLDASLPDFREMDAVVGAP
ncbi:MAG: cytosine/creatinine deaminase [Acetobacteraceae bacterium]|nr:cytosine/creatinine deaminase [Acetobacteraceae bacterium]